MGYFSISIRKKAGETVNKYPHLFEPIQIGTQTVRNRVFMPPISTNLANKGYVTDELVQHYGARARGGVGLIVSEVVTVEPTYIYLPGDLWPGASMTAAWRCGWIPR